MLSQVLCYLVAKLYPTLCNPIDCSLPDSSVHGISQAKILEWVDISFSRGFSWPRGWTHISCISRLVFLPLSTSPMLYQRSLNLLSLFIFGHCSDWVISITLAFGWLVCSYVSLSLLFISSRLFFKLLKSSCLIGPFLYFLFPCYNIQWLYQIFFLIQLILLLLIFWILYLLNCSFLLHFFPKCFILLFKL